MLQASRYPNPVVGVLAEDIGAPAPQNSVARNAQPIQPQTTAQFEQQIELGGKRSARRNLAARSRDLAAWDYEAARIDVLTRVTRDFIDVQAAQEMVTLTAQTTELVSQVQQSVGARVAAGVVSPIEETRANVALAVVRVESSKAARLLQSSRQRLAANWGGTEARFARVVGSLDSGASLPTVLPTLDQLTTRLEQTPELARWATEILQREAAVSIELARRLPDLTLTAGVRRFTLLHSNAFVVGASLPLPLFDRNGGAIAEARSLVAKSYEERRAAEASVAGRLAELYGALATARDDVTALRTIVLPGSRQTFDAITEGYRAGKFGFLDVLDAQRTLISAGVQYLRALSEYHKAVADVERLIGAPLTLPGDEQ
jgi:cobalt-zinc-cadmium efflux system outer membrane protein